MEPGRDVEVRDVDRRRDRWAWRRRIRSDPVRYRIYRIGVAVFGSLLLLLAAITGPLPGPGGIPLFLAGLAVLASEFHWARRLLDRARRIAHRVHEWSDTKPVWLRWVSGLLSLLVLAGVVWLVLSFVPLPAWVPEELRDLLRLVPGVG